MFLFEVKRLIWSALEIEFFELYFLQPVLGGHPVLSGHLGSDLAIPRGWPLVLKKSNKVLSRENFYTEPTNFLFLVWNWVKFDKCLVCHQRRRWRFDDGTNPSRFCCELELNQTSKGKRLLRSRLKYFTYNDWLLSSCS